MGKATSPRVARVHLERLYVFAVVWSVGAFLEKEDRVRLDNYLSSHHSNLALPPRKPGSEDTVFDFVVGPDGNPDRLIVAETLLTDHTLFTGEWDHWKNHVVEFQYPETAVIDYASMLVPNVDSVRTEYLLHTIAKQGKVWIRCLGFCWANLQSDFVLARFTHWRTRIGQNGHDQRLPEEAQERGQSHPRPQLFLRYDHIPISSKFPFIRQKVVTYSWMDWFSPAHH